MALASTSVVPPGAKGTTKLIGFVGQTACAKLSCAEPSNKMPKHKVCLSTLRRWQS
jgi:hypothetical protein